MTTQYKYMVAFIYAIVLFLDRLDLTIVNISLPTIAKVFHVPITATDWINLSFLLALAISIPISSWLGERFGFKKIYILSMILFGAGSTLCAWAPNLTTLFILRFIHGIGGGMLIPLGMTIIYRVFDKSEYASITSYTFIPSLIAPAIAPFLGGILLDIWNWQAVFLFSGPICLILALISILYLKKDEMHNYPALDWPGFILFSFILLDVFYTLSLIGKPNVLPLFLANIILLALLIYTFIWCENKSEFPLIDLRYFTNDVFVKTNFIQLCFQICHFGAIFLIGMYLQVGIGMSASLAGLVMGMQALGAIAISRYSVRLFNYEEKLPITIGLTGVAILSLCIMLITDSKMILFALLLFFIRGLFSGLCGTPIQTLGIITFDKKDIGAINTIFNACRQVSISVGIAISSGLLTLGMYFAHIDAHNPINPQNLLRVFGSGFLAIFVFAVIGIVIVQSLKTSLNRIEKSM